MLHFLPSEEFLPEANMRIEDGGALIACIVHINIFLGRIPGFVGVKGVDEEEELILVLVLFQPLAGRTDRAGNKSVLL